MMGSEESKSQKQKDNKRFVIREVPVNRRKRDSEAEWRKGKSFSGMEKATMMEYDMPELVVFLQEDRAECVTEGCECYGETTETVSSSSSSVLKVPESACRNPRTNNKCGFRNLMMMGEGEHPTKEGSEEEEEAERLILWEKKEGEGEGEGYWRGRGTRGGNLNLSASASRGSSDSISSTQSFTFPILQREWSGSPVRMAEPDHPTSSSRRLRWRHILCPCCKS